MVHSGMARVIGYMLEGRRRVGISVPGKEGYLTGGLCAKVRQYLSV